MNVMMPWLVQMMFLLSIFLTGLYRERFDEVKILDEVPEAILNGMTVLESASKRDSMCKNDGRVVIM